MRVTWSTFARALWFVPLAGLLLDARPAAAQAVDYESLLEWTSRVGQMLHGHHAAKEVALAAVTARGDRPPLHAAGPYDGGWAFSFGDVDEAGAFILDYGVIVTRDGRIDRFDAFDYRRQASVHHGLAARALANVLSDFDALRKAPEFEAEEYRFAVLPFPQGQLTAFVSPAQNQDGFLLLGNDVTYTIDRATGEILNRRRHQLRLMAMPLDQHVGSPLALILPDIPIPSPVHVMNAIEAGRSIAVLTDQGVAMIDPGGTIRRVPDDDPLVRALREAAR